MFLLRVLITNGNGSVHWEDLGYLHSYDKVPWSAAIAHRPRSDEDTVLQDYILSTPTLKRWRPYCPSIM